MNTWNGNRLDGCLFPAASPSEHQVAFAASAEVPRQIDLRSSCTAVEDQGQIGSCTANACVGALEYLYAKRDGQAPELSRLFVYYNTRRLKGTLHLDSGAAVSEAMAAVLAFGACRSELWPYNPALLSAEPAPQAYQDGRKHEAIQYARVAGIDGAIQALAQGYPVVFGTIIPQRCYDTAASTGVIPETTADERRARPSGGHCMLIVGYDLDRKVFHIRNSWGSDWGKGGYCEFPFEEVAWSCPEDSFWMLTELEPKGNFSISKPGVQEAAASADNTVHSKGASAAVTTDMLRDKIRGDLQTDIDQMKEDLRKSILGEPARGTTDPGKPDPHAHVDGEHAEPLSGPSGDSPSELKTPRSDCSVCGGSRKCFHCNATGKIWDDQCRKCTGSGKCYACLYW